MIQEEGSSSLSSSPLQMFSLMSLSPNLGSPFHLIDEMRPEERGLCLIHLLIACANHIASGNIESANFTLEYISHISSPDGDAMQRIASYFSEALANRIIKSWPGIHKALNSTKIASFREEVLVHKFFFELCPFTKLSYMITNHAILDAMEGEKVVHIIDLNAFEPIQWISLFQILSARSEGPPHLRITGVHEQKEVLDQMANRLNEEAGKLNIPFQFNPIVNKLENLDFEILRVKTGEALAISSILQLHNLLAFEDEDAKRNSSPYLQMSPRTKMSSFLESLSSLSPKVMVVTEQESNHNVIGLVDRITEALNYYAALFDCLESTVPKASIERQKIEKMLFGEEIKNIISCEGGDRKNRHEKLNKWITRLELSGFGKVVLSYNVMVQGMRLLQSYNYDGYKIREENGCFLICWQEQPLFSVSAWRFRRCS